MLGQRINSFIALAMVAAVGIGASYLIISFAGATEFSVASSDTSIIFTAEIRKRQSPEEIPYDLLQDNAAGEAETSESL